MTMEIAGIFHLPIWAYFPAIAFGMLVAFLTFVILTKTDLNTWAIGLITVGSFCLYSFCALYLTFLLVR